MKKTYIKIGFRMSFGTTRRYVTYKCMTFSNPWFQNPHGHGEMDSFPKYCSLFNQEDLHVGLEMKCLHNGRSY